MGGDRVERSRRSGSRVKGPVASEFGKGGQQAPKVTARFARCKYLGSMIDAVIAQGALVAFSITMNGSAVVLTLRENDENRREYVADQAQLDDWVGYLLRAFSGSGGAQEGIPGVEE